MVKKKIRILGCVLLLPLLLAIGCGEAQTTIVMEEGEVWEEENELLYVTELDLTTVPTDPVYIEMSEIEGNLVIEEGGEYILSGTTHQTIRIDAHDEIVHLFLNNLTVETADGPAIEAVSGGKLIITLMEDSASALFDAAYYSNKDVTGAISAVCDLTINGQGSLYACGYYKDTIYTKDVFKLLGGTVQLRAKRNGIKGNDGILLAPEYLMIESEKNGCQTSNANKAGKGIIDIQGGELSVVAGQYGLSAASDVHIRDGQVHFNSVVADIYTEGQQYIAEGTLTDE